MNIRITGCLTLIIVGVWSRVLPLPASTPDGLFAGHKQTPAAVNNRAGVYVAQTFPQTWSLLSSSKIKPQGRVRQVRVIILRSRSHQQALAVVVVRITEIPVMASVPGAVATGLTLACGNDAATKNRFRARLRLVPGRYSIYERDMKSRPRRSLRHRPWMSVAYHIRTTCADNWDPGLGFRIS